MKKLIIFFAFIISYDVCPGQFTDVDLNGKVFKGTASEVIPPDSDRMPMIFEEKIIFREGVVYSDLLKMYTAESSSYSAKIDDRRMIALKIVNVVFSSDGVADGKAVNINFNGNLIGDNKFTGYLTIKYPDMHEVNYIISADLE